MFARVRVRWPFRATGRQGKQTLPLLAIHISSLYIYVYICIKDYI